jgi:hypothetical protein
MRRGDFQMTGAGDKPALFLWGRFKAEEIDAWSAPAEKPWVGRRRPIPRMSSFAEGAWEDFPFIKRSKDVQT